MGKKPAIRTNITIPADLKKRMGAVKEDVNWSAVACAAFESKLAEIASRKQEKNMDDVIQRLRASKLESDDQDFTDGVTAGLRWASHDAEAADLMALERWQNAFMREWDTIFEENETRASTAAELVFFAIAPAADHDRATASDFWEGAIGDDHKELIANPVFLKGFVEGALALWHQVKRKL